MIISYAHHDKSGIETSIDTTYNVKGQENTTFK